LLPRKKKSPTQPLFYILVASQNGSPRKATQQASHTLALKLLVQVFREGKMRKSNMQNEMISNCPSLSKRSSRLLGTSRFWEIDGESKLTFCCCSEKSYLKLGPEKKVATVAETISRE
jgi:hypothetical protein